MATEKKSIFNTSDLGQRCRLLYFALPHLLVSLGLVRPMGLWCFSVPGNGHEMAVFYPLQCRERAHHWGVYSSQCLVPMTFPLPALRAVRSPSLVSCTGGSGWTVRLVFQRGVWAGCPGFHAPAQHLSFAGISRAKNSLGASAEIVGQSILLTTQKFAGGGGWRSPPDFMPVRMTEACMCSEQLLAFRRPWVVTCAWSVTTLL